MMLRRFAPVLFLIALGGAQQARAEEPATAETAFRHKFNAALTRWECPTLTPAEVGMIQSQLSADPRGFLLGVQVPMSMTQRPRSAVSIHRNHYHTGAPDSKTQGYTDATPSVGVPDTLAMVGVDLDTGEVIQLFFGGWGGCVKDPQKGWSAPTPTPPRPAKKPGKPGKKLAPGQHTPAPQSKGKGATI